MSVETAPLNSLSCEAQALLADTSIRPMPQHMASLVLRGLTDEHLIQGWSRLGRRVPDTALLTRELAHTVPWIAMLSDTLAHRAQNGALHVFAARDAEPLFDDFAITHQNLASTLLPASTRLWNDATNKPWLEDGKARSFLSNHGITEEVIASPRNKLVVVDTGFNGTVGKRLAEVVSGAYNTDKIRLGGRLAIKLVHANPGSGCERITDVDNFDAMQFLPRMYTWLGDELFDDYVDRGDSTIPLAISLQLHPRYHGTYTSFSERQDGTVIAIPDPEDVAEDINASADGENNSSIVNPLAAAIVQRHVVSNALRRKPSNRPDYKSWKMLMCAPRLFRRSARSS
jgi:hypothetical protein